MLRLFLVLWFVGVLSRAENCDGVLCITHKDISRQFQPRIDLIKKKIEIINEMTMEQLASGKNSIQRNIADAISVTNGQLGQTRKTLNLARNEAAKQIPRLQLCLNGLGIELGRILPLNYNGCYSSANFTIASNTRSKILQLGQTLNGVVNNCIALNPTGTDLNDFKTCVENKLVQIEVRVRVIQKEFDQVLREVMNSAVNCIMRINAETNGKIGAVLNGIHTCKHQI